MKTSQYFLCVLLTWIGFNACEKRSTSPDANLLSAPSDFRAESYYRSIQLFWTPLHQKDIARYKIYYGTTSKNYTDTLSVPGDVNTAQISNLEVDQKYYCAITTIDVNRKESERSDEIGIRTYLVFEDFSEATDSLDTTRWHYEVGYSVPIVEGKVAAAAVQFNDELIRKSFGQYLNYTPVDNFVVECDFMLGTPNVGGAGLMICSELANPEKYYKGYNAFIFWNLNNWELRLEESLVDRRAMPNATPLKLPEIRSDEWIKLSLLYKNRFIEAAVFRLPDYSVLGKISASDTVAASRRPHESDRYCGFFTSQYGANIIYADNFGIRKLD